MTRRTGPRVAALAAVVALLAGCTPAPPDPMSDQLRSAIQQDRAERAWTGVSIDYPEAIQPQVDVGPALGDAAWVVASKQCLRERGFVVVPDGASFDYSSSDGQTPLQFAVARYHCAMAVPAITELTDYLDIYQLADLYAYYVHTVQPCLALNGVSVARPPTLRSFRSNSGALQWSPFAALTGTQANARRLADLAAVCPEAPGWLHL
jgi:hypothetical protein